MASIHYYRQPEGIRRFWVWIQVLHHGSALSLRMLCNKRKSFITWWSFRRYWRIVVVWRNLLEVASFFCRSTCQNYENPTKPRSKSQLEGKIFAKVPFLCVYLHSILVLITENAESEVTWKCLAQNSPWAYLWVNSQIASLTISWCRKHSWFLLRKPSKKTSKKTFWYMKPNTQLITALVLSIGGLTLLFLGVFIDPQGQIHETLLVAFGETATFAGALFGIDYTYRHRKKE